MNGMIKKLSSPLRKWRLGCQPSLPAVSLFSRAFLPILEPQGLRRYLRWSMECGLSGSKAVGSRLLAAAAWSLFRVSVFPVRRAHWQRWNLIARHSCTLGGWCIREHLNYHFPDALMRFLVASSVCCEIFQLFGSDCSIIIYKWTHAHISRRCKPTVDPSDLKQNTLKVSFKSFSTPQPCKCFAALSLSSVYFLCLKIWHSDTASSQAACPEGQRFMG